MLHRPRNRTVAGAFFLTAALVPVGVWAILLLSGVPRTQSRVEHAAYALSYLLTESEGAWFFVLMAVLPIPFLALGTWCWLQRASTQKVPTWAWVVNAVATLAALVVFWPAAIASVAAGYYAHRLKQ